MTERQKTTALSSRADRSGVRTLTSAAKWKFAVISVLIFVVLFSVLSAVLANAQRESGLGVVLSTPLETIAPELPAMIYVLPVTMITLPLD